MKGQKDLDANILQITMKIRDQYPELSKYIQEMPVTIPDDQNPEMNLKIMQEYYNSLEVLLRDYINNKHDSVS